MIIGKKANEENSTPFVFEQPFDFLLDCTENLAIDVNTSANLLANHPTRQMTTLFSIGGKYNPENSEVNENLLAYDSTLTRLGIRAGFKSFLKDAVFGDYGLKITVYDKRDQVSSQTNSWQPRENVLFFSASKDMYGNPYNYETFYRQEKVFDISTLGIITGIKVEFYQGRWDTAENEEGIKTYTLINNSFLDKNGNPLPYSINNMDFPDNIFVDHLYIGLGYDLRSFDEDYATLYTFDTSTYIKSKSKEENKKEVNLRWVHINSEGKPIDVHKDDSSLGLYDVRWYRYKLGAPSADEYSGVYWEKTNLDKEVTNEYELADLNELTTYYLLFHYQDNDLEKKITTNETTYIKDFTPVYQEAFIQPTKPISTTANRSYMGYWTKECLDQYNISEELAQHAFAYQITNNIVKYVDQSWEEIFNSGFVYHDNEYDITDYATGYSIQNVGCMHKVGFWEKFTLAYKLYWKYPEEFNMLLGKDKAEIFSIGGANCEEWIPFSGKNLFTELSYSGEIPLADLSGTTFNINTSNNALRVLFTYFTKSFGTWSYISDKYGMKDFVPGEWVRNVDTGKYEPKTAEDALLYEILYVATETLYKKIDDPSYIARVKANHFSFDFYPDTTLAEEKLKAVILYDDTYLSTQILTFTNEEETPSYITLESANALVIHCQDETYGNYLIYDESNSLIDSAQSSIERTCECHFDLDYFSDETKNSLLTEAERIVWSIPGSYTMLSVVNDSDIPIRTSKGIIRERAIINPDLLEDYDPADPLKYEYSYDIENKMIMVARSAAEDGSINPYLKYYINSYYAAEKQNNNIYCTIVKDTLVYTTQKEFTFGQAGTSGTDCTLIIDIDNNETALTVGSTDSLVLTARLYDADNKEQSLDECEISWSWYKTSRKEGEAIHIDIGQPYMDENNITYKHKCELKANQLTIDELYIIQCSVLGWGNYELVAYLPIPIRASANYRFISGATKILYNSSGVSSYYKQPYSIFYSESGSNTSGFWDSITGVWSGFYPSAQEKEIAYMPEVKQISHRVENNEEVTETVLDGYRLAPVEMYIDNLAIYGVQYSIMENGEMSVKWSQPILIIQNKYPSAMINQWDGKTLTIDEQSGAIMSTMLSAGSKDSENRFSGVMLGDWGKNTGDSVLKSNTGLFGFHQGAMSFAFKDDGTAFIGKSGKGQINFDGNSGSIQSLSYSETGTGMKIDLDDGVIDIRGSKVVDEEKTGAASYVPSGSQVKISSLDPYLKIIDDNKKTLMNVGTEGYYLQSSNFSSTNGTGVKFDLSNGSLTGYNFTIYGKSSKGNIIISSDNSNYPIRVGSRFYVDWDGTLYAQGGTIDGEFFVNGSLNGGSIYGAEIQGAKISGSSIQVQYKTTPTTVTLPNGQQVITAVASQGGIEFYDGTTFKGYMGNVSGNDGTNVTRNLGLSTETADIDTSILVTSSKHIALRTGGSTSNTNAPSEGAIYLTSNKQAYTANEIRFNCPASGQWGIYARFA